MITDEWSVSCLSRKIRVLVSAEFSSMFLRHFLKTPQISSSVGMIKTISCSKTKTFFQSQIIRKTMWRRSERYGEARISDKSSQSNSLGKSAGKARSRRKGFRGQFFFPPDNLLLTKCSFWFVDPFLYGLKMLSYDE